jgi:osmotically-inducible protein OsmY
MMNSNSTPKIVVGIGLAVVFGVGVSVFAVRAKHENELARSVPAPALAAPSDQNATDASAPTANAAPQTPSDQVAPAASAPSAAPSQAPAAVPQTPPTTSNSSKDGGERHLARTHNGASTSGTRVASAESVPNSPAPVPSSSDATSSAPTDASADSQSAAAQAGQEGASGAGPVAASSEAVASDSQITAAVKFELASAAPSSNVDVTTTNGVVALAGSVPSQDNVEQARQAAQRVAGVKHVDASALVVSNQ